MTFNETPPPSKTSPLVDDDLDEDEVVKVAKNKVLDKVDEALNIKESKNHPLGNIIGIKLFQMDVKSAFLNGFNIEELYLAQPPGFIDFEKPDHVYKLKKAL
nr:copia protein [Tanacetum cinerariifolium]